MLVAYADNAGREPLSPKVWTVRLPSTGDTFAIVEDESALSGVMDIGMVAFRSMRWPC